MRRGVLDVLHGISFALHRGKTTCIVGESGSGKSMTARTILNMVPRPGVINGGRILFDPDGKGADATWPSLTRAARKSAPSAAAGSP